VLLDSNTIIYRAQGLSLDKFVNNTGYVSIITKIEVLGFPKLTEKEKNEFEKFFREVEILPVTEVIAQTAIFLKQKKKISIPDSIIASTALVHKIPLLSANTKDFKWIPELKLINPLE
jgi:toxin FitB